MPITSIQLTREELYQRVWSEALTTLGPKLGLSDVGLRKLCKRMLIPLPGVRYRARKASGRSVKRTPLPPMPADDERGTVTLYPALIEQKRFERESVNTIVVNARLDSPHPLVLATIKALRRARLSDSDKLRINDPSSLNVRVGAASVDRAMRIMDALIKACEKRGWSVSVGPAPRTRTIVRVFDEDVGVSLDEFVGGKPGVAGYAPSGSLFLQLAPSRQRSMWADTETQRVEGLLNEFMIGLVVAAIEARNNRIATEEWQRQRDAEQQLHRDTWLRTQRAAAMERALNHVVREHQRVRQIREYIADARAVPIAANYPALVEWLEWAASYADSIDPLLPEPKVPDDPDPPKSPPWFSA